MKHIGVIGLLGVIGLFGCAKKDEFVIETPDGKATVNQGADGKTVIETDKGKLEVDDKSGGVTMTSTDDKGNKTTVSTSTDFDESKLGVRLYPGAKMKDGAGSKSSVTGPMGTMMTVVMETSDSPEKVIEFYKGELKDPKPFSGPEAGMVTGKSPNGDEVTAAASLVEESKSTLVTLSVTTKNPK